MTLLGEREKFCVRRLIDLIGLDLVEARPGRPSTWLALDPIGARPGRGSIRSGLDL